MLGKVIDTNIFTGRFLNPELHRDIFLSEGLTYLSAVVFMELRAWAHTRAAVRAVYDLYAHFIGVGRLLLPSVKDYERAGEIIAKLQSVKGYTIRKSASITNDCLPLAAIPHMGIQASLKADHTFSQTAHPAEAQRSDMLQ